MSRYSGPRLKVMRALGTQLPGLSRKNWEERKPYPPGMHQGTHRKKPTVYAIQLKEKQKLRYNYGLNERQLRRFVKLSFKAKGSPGENLLQLLERRLDNTVFRMGYAPTIPAARQLISHGHIKVDDQKVDKASFMVRAGHEITLSKKGSEMGHVNNSLENISLTRPSWVDFDDSKKMGKVISLPDRESVSFPIQVKLVVEYYSR